MKKAFYRKISRAKLRRQIKLFYVIFVIAVGMWQLYKTSAVPGLDPQSQPAGTSQAASALKQLAVKGRAAKTGYSRQMFSDGWGELPSCDVRNFILARDMTDVTFVGTTCKVKSGTLMDPYGGTSIAFVRGPDTSDDIQIDHIVALGDAWQKGAQQITSLERYALANDPLNLLAVDGKINQDKGDSDAATWLPPNKAFRCEYVARQISVKLKYKLWVTPAEYQAMAKTLLDCPTQAMPSPVRP